MIPALLASTLLTPTAAAQEATPPLSVALLAGVPFLGNDHTLDEGSLVDVSPGLLLRGELAWGRPPVRGGIALTVTDSFFLVSESWAPQYVEAALDAQADIRLTRGAWELRLPIEGGFGVSSILFPIPTIRAGLGLRAQQAEGRRRAMVELRGMGALGATYTYNCLGDCASGGTASGWQVSANGGVTFGGAGG